MKGNGRYGNGRKTEMKRISRNLGDPMDRLKDRLNEGEQDFTLTDISDVIGQEVEASLAWWEKKIRDAFDD